MHMLYPFVSIEIVYILFFALRFIAQKQIVQNTIIKIIENIYDYNKSICNVFGKL